MRAIVVGAGIFGLTGALELRRRGWGVTVLDPGPVPHPLAASTDISKVVRADYGADAFTTDLALEAIAGWHRWNAEWNETLYHEDGFLLLAGAPMAPGGFEHDSFAALTARGVPCERLDRDALRARFPAWNADRYPDGYLDPRAGWVESGRAIERLAAAARDAGIEVIEGVRIGGLVDEDGRPADRPGARVAGVAGHDDRADAVVVAVGTWTPTLLPWLADRMWSVGQPVLHFRVDPRAFRPPAFRPFAADISRTGWYGFPALEDGTLKVANHGTGRRLHPDAPRHVTPEDEARFRAFFRESLPALADAPLVHTRLCLYSDTFDGDFWIDRDPEREGLVVAAGGSGHAFKFGPLLGRFVADAVEGRAHPRFAWRERAGVRTEHARNG